MKLNSAAKDGLATTFENHPLIPLGTHISGTIKEREKEGGLRHLRNMSRMSEQLKRLSQDKEEWRILVWGLCSMEGQQAVASYVHHATERLLPMSVV